MFSPVNILLWANGLSYLSLTLRIDVITERKLYKDTTDSVIRVQTLNFFYHLFDFGLCWELDMGIFDANFDGSLPLHTDIH